MTQEKWQIELGGDTMDMPKMIYLTLAPGVD
jgi:hypothetical protein